MRILVTKKNCRRRQKTTLSNNENENAIDRSNENKIETNPKLKIKQK